MDLKFKEFTRLGIFTLTLALFTCLFTMESYADSLKVREVVSPKYEDAMRFSEDLLAVKKNGKWGYINKNGDVVLDFKYHIAYPFSEGKALVAIKKSEIPEWDDVEYEFAYWGVIDKKGNFTNLKRTDGELLNDFADDYLEGIYKSNNYTGYHNGVLVTDILDSPVNFTFDSSGNEISYGYGAYPLNEGILPINDGTARFIDFSSGETLFKDKEFYNIRPFNQGLAPVALDDGTDDPVWRFMDRNGGMLKDITFINFQVQNMFGEYKVFSDNSLASIQNTQGKWGAIDKAGKTVVPFKYDQLKMFTEGLAGFKLNGKYGFVDVDGKVCIEPIYDNVSAFNNGLASVYVGDSAYLIDKEGNKISGSDAIPKSIYFKKNSYGENDTYYTFSPEEYIIIEKNSKYGVGRIELIDREEDPVEEDPVDEELIVSPQIEQIQLKSKADFTSKAKPASNIKILVNGEEKSLSDPIIMENGRVFLPVRALGKLLDIEVDYIEANKVAIAENDKAKLELPLGYNQAVKDMSIILPVDEANKSTRILSYKSRTYLPVRFISENLGFKIDYADQIISIISNDF